MRLADFPPLSPPIHAHKGKHSPYSIIFNRDLCETHCSNYVSSTSKSVSTKTVCKPARIVSCNKPDIFSQVCKSRHSSNICISKTVHCSVSCKPVSTLINSEPIKSFVSCKTVCFSNVSMAKKLNSVNYCFVACTEHPVNVISAVVCYKTACPVDFDIVVETINVTLLSSYRFFSFKIPHCISPTVISISKLPLHLARPPATLSVCSSPSSASSPPSPSTYHFSKIPSSSPLFFLFPPPPSASSSQSALSLSPSSSSASPSQSTFFFPLPHQHHQHQHHHCYNSRRLYHCCHYHHHH